MWSNELQRGHSVNLLVTISNCLVSMIPSVLQHTNYRNSKKLLWTNLSSHSCKMLAHKPVQSSLASPVFYFPNSLVSYQTPAAANFRYADVFLSAIFLSQTSSVLISKIRRRKRTHHVTINKPAVKASRYFYIFNKTLYYALGKPGEAN